MTPPQPKTPIALAVAAHSRIPPSSAARRIQCTQSATWEPLYPDDENDQDTREGTASHWAAAEQLMGRLVDVGQVAPNGVVLDAEMVAGADMMYADVVHTLERYGLKPQQGQCEARVFIPRVHPEQFGSPDFYILIARPGRPYLLLLWDYKYGHRFVDVFENAQVIDYIAGICNDLSDIDPGVEIVATIVQPRSFGHGGAVRRWETTLLALRALINVSSNAAHEALGPNPRTRTGPECRDCKARHACPTLQAEGFAGMDLAKRATPLEMTPQAAGLEKRMLDRAIVLLTARSKGLGLQLERLARSGKQTPGWRLESGQAREKWKVPAAQVIATGALMRLDLAKPVEAVTPNQARDKGLDPAIVALLAERGPAGVTLVEDDGSLARRVFGC